MTDSDDAPALRLPFDTDEVAARPLRTERMSLRPLRDDDVDDVWAYQRVPEVLRFIPWPETDQRTAAAHTKRRVLQRLLAIDGDAIALAMELDGRVVGDLTVILRSVDNATIELGWVINPDHAGRGLASEAASAAVDWAFDRLGAHRIVARIDARNTASARLAERIGMRREAVHLGDTWFKGEWVDTEVWAVLRRERMPRP